MQRFLILVGFLVVSLQSAASTSGADCTVWADVYAGQVPPTTFSPACATFLEFRVLPLGRADLPVSSRTLTETEAHQVLRSLGFVLPSLSLENVP